MKKENSTQKPNYVGKHKHTGLVKAAEEMFHHTKKQVVDIGKMLPEGIDSTYKNQTHDFVYIEPRKNNRFSLKFPKRFNISDIDIISTTRPFFSVDADKQIVVILREFINGINIRRLIREAEKKKFKLKLNIFDPTGIIIEKWMFLDCVIKEISCSDLDYTNDDISSIQLIITYDSIK